MAKPTFREPIRIFCRWLIKKPFIDGVKEDLTMMNMNVEYPRKMKFCRHKGGSYSDHLKSLFSFLPSKCWWEHVFLVVPRLFKFSHLCLTLIIQLWCSFLGVGEGGIFISLVKKMVLSRSLFWYDLILFITSTLFWFSQTDLFLHWHNLKLTVWFLLLSLHISL